MESEEPQDQAVELLKHAVAHVHPPEHQPEKSASNPR